MGEAETMCVSDALAQDLCHYLIGQIPSNLKRALRKIDHSPSYLVNEEGIGFGGRAYGRILPRVQELTIVLKNPGLSNWERTK